MFERNRKSVAELVEFDRTLTDLVVESFKVLNRKWRAHLEREHQLTGPALDSHPLTGAHQLKTFQNIRENDSLQGSFRAVHNLALVSLVSFFASATRDLFRAIVAETMERDASVLKDRELRLTVGDLLNAERGAVVAHALEETEKISFQDMKSVGRAFKLVLRKDIDRDSHVNNIVVAQACRHAFVHFDGVADAKLLYQIRDADPRTIQPNLTLSKPIEFAPEEITATGDDMAWYLNRVAELARGAG